MAARSPFPGMDPYLEARWGDVHASLCVGIRAALQPVLPPGLRARAQEEVIVETSDDFQRQRWVPDAYVVRTGGFTGATAVAAEVASVRPILIKPLPDERRDRWVEILDTTAGNRVVTAVEVLSPANKARGPRNEQYRQKVAHYLEAGVNVVEIDLLRSKRHDLRIDVDDLPADRRGTYMASVQRATREDGAWEVYPIPLRDPLPTIAIPCRPGERDVPLALQPLIDRIYVEGAHDDIDYSKPLDPPLSPDDQRWLDDLLAARRSA